MLITDLRKLIHEVYKVESISMDLAMQDRLIQSGLGFFPYGSGLLIENNNELPENGLMVVGQDFGNIGYLNSNIIKNGEADKPTFRKTVDMIAGYPKEQVFLTNLFMGLRKNTGMIGDNPALKNDETCYLNASVAFFELQLKHVKPSKIIVLGKTPYNFICNHFKATPFKVRTFGSYIAETIPNRLFEINQTQVLCIPHPSMWNSNVKNPDEWKRIIRDFLAIN